MLCGVHRSGHDTPLDELLRDRLSGFFARLGDTPPGDLYRVVIGQVERSLVEVALDRAGGSQLGAARLLGVHRNTMRAMVRRHGLARARRRRR
jgi:DNA-binding protein Fis